MRFLLYDSEGREQRIGNVFSYEIASEIGTPCDSLRINFECEEDLKEIYAVKAYSGEKLIFNGFCDLQQITNTHGGRECFIYSRSSASLLTDNEAVPCQYNCPSARQLWFSNAEDFGFECGLPEVCSKSSYLVSKGTSCYSAVNDFVYALYGSSVYVTPDNVLKAHSPGDIKRLSSYELYSVSYIISRCEPIDRIDYKINSADSYTYHFESRFLQKRDIKRKRLLNLSSLPAWQRENSAKKRISDSLSDYYTLRAVICGECDLSLNDRVIADLNGFEDEEFYVYETVRSKGKDGEKTTTLLKKHIDGDLVNYVD